MIATKDINEAVRDNRKAMDNVPLVETLVKRAATVKGIKSSDEENNLTAQEICRKIRQLCPELTLSELGLIIDEGVYGGFGEYFGLNAVTFIAWIQTYFQKYNKIRLSALADYSRLALPPAPEITDEQQDEIVRAAVIVKFHQYTETAFFQDLGNVAYNYLFKHGIINPTNAEKLDVYKRLYQEKLAYEKNSKKKHPIMSFAQLIIEQEKNAKYAAIHESKNYFVLQFFDSLIANNLPITDYI